MVDRLSDVRRDTTAVDLRSASMYSNPDPGGPSPATSASASGAPTLDDFYMKVTEVQNGIRDIRQLSAQIQQLYVTNLQVADKAESKRASDELEEKMERVTALSERIKSTVKVMGDNAKSLKDTNDKSRVAEVRIMENQHGFLLKQFIDVMKQYHTMQTENEKKYKDQVVRRLKTKFQNDDGSTISEAKAQQMADDLLKNGDQDRIFQQSKHKLEQIIETRNEVIRIEKSIRELQQLFVDLAALVHEQGEILNDISDNMTTTMEYMEEGVKQMKQARKYNRKSRKKMMWAILCLLIIIAAISIPVFGMS
eukprot:PhM_4_TR3822/c0_g1_i1/m.61657